MKRLDGLAWVPRATSHMGCLEGCVRRLGIQMSPGWLYGGTGHAFFINVDEDLCPSGPHSWPYFHVVPKLGKNLGLQVDVHATHKSHKDFAERQEAIWGAVRGAIDRGFPCYGWHYEFIVIAGYDETAYLLSGPMDAPRGWREFGASSAPGFVEIAVVRRREAAQDRTVAKDALTFATQLAKSREGRADWGGFAAYDKWVKGLESGGEISSDGSGYHAAIWAECRGFAVEFLQEAGRRLGDGGGELFERAAGHYAQVRDSLQAVARLFPFPDAATPEARRKEMLEQLKGYATDQPRRKEAAGHVREARGAEGAAVVVLEQITKSL